MREKRELQVGIINISQFHQVSLKSAFQRCTSMDRDGDTDRNSRLEVDEVASIDAFQLPSS